MQNNEDYPPIPKKYSSKFNLYHLYYPVETSIEPKHCLNWYVRALLFAVMTLTYLLLPIPSVPAQEQQTPDEQTQSQEPTENESQPTTAAKEGLDIEKMTPEDDTVIGDGDEGDFAG